MGNILVTDSPLPEQMASIIQVQGYSKGVLSLYQDQAFFEWRFKNPVHRYVFYYFMDGNVVRGYIVVDVSPNNLRGTILDYGEYEDQAINQLLRYITKAKGFIVISIYSYGVDDQLRKELSDLGFSTTHPLKRLLKKLY